MISRGRIRLAFLVLIAASCVVSAQPMLKPYVLAAVEPGTVAEQLADVETALEGNGFEIVGQYAPYEGARILVITSPELIQTAQQSEFGGYGAVLRVSLTQDGDEVQLAYTNPAYLRHVYRLESSNEVAAGNLQNALGSRGSFGSKDGLSVEKLRKYHYTVMMPYFDDQDKLAEHDSHEAALATVEAGLAAGTEGAEKIYRVEVGPETTLFGVALREGHGADRVVMENCDRETYKHTAYMPYEILVSGNKAYALPGKFRIALSFPDLSMGTFMKISRAPGAIKGVLRDVARAQ